MRTTLPKTANECNERFALLYRNDIVSFLLLIQLCRIDDIYELLQGQSKSKKAIGQREGLEESGNRRSIFGGFFKKKFN